MWTLLKGRSELFLVTAVVGILLMLFVPVPAVILDILLIANFAFALMILLLTFYSEKPLSFSTFPSLLLIATLFRLGLNISATRLILNDGDAGVVISSIGSYVVGGNFVVGLVVFFILVIIQYVVVTNGAQRVAEVAARFTLDSMPGKQMSIDADLNMGIIDEQTAKDRRKEIEKESNFYGAMDGSTKFVKGDAIAGIIIILIDIIGGLAIGVAQLGLPWSEALEKYTLLTVGDGIVTQVPSLIIATATGIIITRAASDSKLGQEISKQAMSSPQTLTIVGLTLAAAMAIPAFPTFPIFIMSSFFLTLAWFSYRQNKLPDVPGEDNDNFDESTQALQSDVKDEDIFKIYPLELQVSSDVDDGIKANGNILSEKLKAFRAKHYQSTGYTLPELTVKHDNLMPAHEYKLKMFGATIAAGQLHFDKYLVIDPKGHFEAIKGIKGTEPTYRLPAMWVEEGQLEAAKNAKYTVVDPETTLLTHLTEIIKAHGYELLTRGDTEALLTQLKTDNASLIDELIPEVLTYSEVQKILKNLLKEKVPIHNLDLILEVLLDYGRTSKEIIYLTQQCRVRLKSQICQNLVDQSGQLNVITIAPKLEQTLIAGVKVEGEKASLAIEPRGLDHLVTQLTQKTEKCLIEKVPPVLITHSSVRFALSQMMERVIPQLNILSVDEIPTFINVKALSSVDLLAMPESSLTDNKSSK
ncbi:FHIPEP family type III secretion protein [Catenovulum sp. SM1970]|uniref:flagellar biosynthesis protein FlhA n=1 Tax=Marinifaba aquimaris TaxID=2741323 RepID=UPI00157195A1|nr:flagellar biosynthesis protein FlhA [Marinifaba aquimaris]NTS77395.1 FHIPEP family type III secretion protein [Marinifaba aquimaris]